MSITSTYRNSYHTVHLQEDPARSVVWEVLADYLAPYIPANARVLELGAGYCYWINGIVAAHKVAADLWDEFSRYAAPDVSTVQIDLTAGLALQDRSFDVVLASDLLEHFPPDTVGRLVEDIFHLLDYGGRFIIIQPNFRYAYRSYFDDYTHRAVFTDVSLPNLLRAHRFGVERVDPRFLPYSLRDSKLPIRPWLIRTYLHSLFKPLAGQMLVIGRKPSQDE